MGLSLYRLEGCPFCEFVVDELHELDVEYDSIWVDGHHSLRHEVKRRSGQRRIPLIVDDDAGVTMHETARIFEYLRATYGDDDVDVDVDADDEVGP